MTQQQVKALEEEARTRIKADEARSTRFHQAVERVSGEVDSLARRLEAEERATLPRVAKMEVRSGVRGWSGQKANWNINSLSFSSILVHLYKYEHRRIVASLHRLSIAVLYFSTGKSFERRVRHHLVTTNVQVKLRRWQGRAFRVSAPAADTDSRRRRL